VPGRRPRMRGQPDDSGAAQLARLNAERGDAERG
jgi:hypothetical protein